MSRYIAVDIGGTRMRAANYADEGLNPIRLERISTQPPNRDESILARLDNLILSVLPQSEEIRTISVAAPGPVNPYTGRCVKKTSGALMLSLCPD